MSMVFLENCVRVDLNFKLSNYMSAYLLHFNCIATQYLLIKDLARTGVWFAKALVYSISVCSIVVVRRPNVC